MPFIDLSKKIKNYEDLACAINQMDYVVTVDTGTVHLAGALGKPTYLLLPFTPDWRWGLEETNPWYPSVTSIRQKTWLDWQTSMKEVVKRLRSQK